MKMLMAVAGVFMLSMLAFGGSVQAGELHDAAAAGDLDRIQSLLKAGADINAKYRNGETALHMAVSHSHYDVMEFLLEAGADVHAKDNSGATPLHWAAYSGFNGVGAIWLLLKAGADVHARDNDGDTPLHSAFDGHMKVIQALLTPWNKVKDPSPWDREP